MSAEHAAPPAPMARLVLDGPGCEHLQELGEPAAPRAESCEECGARKVLRVCLDCGHVGCCESRHGHAAQHAKQTGHLLIRAWRGGAFTYCYAHGYL